MRIKGKGQSGRNGGPRGDLYIILRVQPDTRFERKKNDLIATVDVDLYTATLGGKVTVPTMTKTIKMTVPKGSKPSAKLRLKGKRMPIYGKSKAHGDLLVKLKVIFPENLSAEEIALFEQLQVLRKLD